MPPSHLRRFSFHHCYAIHMVASLLVTLPLYAQAETATPLPAVTIAPANAYSSSGLSHHRHFDVGNQHEYTLLHAQCVDSCNAYCPHESFSCFGETSYRETRD